MGSASNEDMIELKSGFLFE